MPISNSSHLAGHNTVPIGSTKYQNNALAGFDPFFSTKTKHPVAARSTHLSGSVTPPCQPEESRDGEGSPDNRPFTPPDMASELRVLAMELSKLSSSKSSSQLKPQTLTTIRHDNQKVIPKNTSPVKKEKGTFLPWQRKTNRKTDYFATATSTSKGLRTQNKQPATATRGRSTGASIKANPTSPLLQELWDVQKEFDKTAKVKDSLAIPSLAKPRPTSFLTGMETIRTPEYEAAEWQVSIPAKTEFQVCIRLSQYLETYQKEECLLNLNDLTGASRMELASFARGSYGSLTGKIADCHRPIVESLLECGSDIQQICGFLTSDVSNSDPSSRREVLIVERQRQFLCVFRGTNTEQLGKAPKDTNVTILKDTGIHVSVFIDRYKALCEIEGKLFTLIDQLVEENPFYDVVFSGHGYAAGLATLASYRYASARPELRIGSLVSASPKVGFDDFRKSVNSLSNLKVFRLECGHSKFHSSSSHACHVGHSIRIHPSKHTVSAYRFSTWQGGLALPFKREKDVSSYAAALESLGSVWIADFHREDGAGVRGTDNEVRLMV